MKKIISVLALIVFISSCTVIDPNLTGKRIVTEPRDDYAYSPTYSSYGSSYGSFYNPYMWSSWYGWWNPFWLYGYNNYYSRYNPYLWGWYSSGSGSGYTGQTAITKRQLSNSGSRTLSNGKVIKGTSRTVRTSGTRSTSSGTRSTVSRTGSSRSTSSGTRSTVSRTGSSRSRSSSSSRGTVRRIKK